MRYEIGFLEPEFRGLVDHLFSGATTERAAFLHARLAIAERKTKLLVRRVIPVADADIESASARHMVIKSRAYLRAIKQAALAGDSFGFVHSHPPNVPGFSDQDDIEETALFGTAFLRIHHQSVGMSVVFSSSTEPRARVWLENGSHQDVDRIRVLGRTFSTFGVTAEVTRVSDYFDRQVRAFGGELQTILGSLRVGVVGLGGTGSAVSEQLIRLGVGTLVIVDDGHFDVSNVSRLHGSTVFDADLAKTDIVARLAAMIGLGTEVVRIPRHLSYRSAAQALVDCDAVFGCTDDEWGRSILNRLAIWYHVPVFDMGVQIDPRVKTFQGRVTTLMPGAACLLCRKRISSDRVRAEAIAATDPERAAQLRREGYLVGADAPAPAVVSLTTSMASVAVSELLDRLTGFMGDERTATEVLLHFDRARMRTNSTPSMPGCFCADRANWGRGDTRRFLDLNWRAE